MRYSVWYFCNVAKLSIVETKGVLKIAKALNCTQVSFAERNNAVNCLREYDSLVQSYMIPELTACLFADEHRKYLKEIPDSPEKENYLEKIRDLLLNLSPDRKRLSMTDLILNLQNIEYTDAVKCVVAYERSGKTLQEGSIGYLEGEGFFQEIFLLSILCCVSRINTSMVSDLVRGEEQIELMQLALTGCFGQLCWNIAIEIMLRCGMPTYEAIRLFPKNWQERPDMVELIAPFFFADEEGRDSVQEIMKETYKLSRFMRYWAEQTEFQNGFWMGSDITEKERAQLCIVLWQNVLWNLAMDRDPNRCMELLKDNWETPTFEKGNIGSRLQQNKCQYWMIPENVRVNKEEQLCRYICSPWQERTESQWGKGSGKKVAAEQSMEELFHEFRGFVHNDNGLKVFMAVSLLERVFMVRDSTIDDFYIRLLLHFGDLFSCYGARSTFQQVTSPPIDGIRVTAWKLPVRALGYWAYDIVKNIGMGIVNESVPEKIIRHLSRRSPVVSKHDNYKNKQLDYLYKSCAFLSAAYWAYESLATTSISQDGMDNAWLKKGYRSSGATLCRWIFKHLNKQAVNDRGAVQLYVQAFDSNFSAAMENRTPNWLKDIESGKVIRVHFNQLILYRKLTYDEWNKVGDITRKKFDKDAYLIAHTLRIRTLFEAKKSTVQGHVWIAEWEEAISDVSYKWEFSRMARYIMMQMFTIIPGCEENYGVLAELLKKVICMIQEFASLDSVYYIYRLAESLIELPDRLGEETRNELRGINAVELFRNMESTAVMSENHIWEDLFYYYLLGISDNMQIESQRYAGKQLKDYWENKRVWRKHLRTDLIEPDNWDKWADRMWLAKDGKLLVVRSALDISNCSMTGVVAEARRGSDKTNEYLIYSGDKKRKFEEEQQKFRKGDIVEVEMNDNLQTNKIHPIGWKPEKGERLHAKFEITGDKLEVYVLGTCFEKNFKESPELFGIWNGDYSELFTSRHDLKGTAIVEYAEYDVGKLWWIPFRNRYSEFLVQKMFLPDNPERKCILTYLGGTEKELVFSAKAGENYILEAENWTHDSWMRLKAELQDNGNRKGTRLQVCLRNVNKFPRLELYGQEPWDYRNLQWREQFISDQPVQIWNENDKWVTETNVAEIRRKIIVHLKNIWMLDKNSKHYMQVTEDGWGEYNQRKGYLEVEELKSRILDYATVTYEELRRLIQIKAGDIFKLRSVRFRQQTKGYYLAELDNKMTVFCAAESLSLLSDSKDGHFWKNRLCMVENVNEKKHMEEYKAEPCNLEELKGKQKKYMGIVAEFTQIINSNKSEYAENLTLKIFLDVDGRKIAVNAPITSFSPKPQHLGDRIEAENVEGGWIFRTQCRSVNVRALWQIEDHRGKKEMQIFGAPLGLTDISRLGSCMVTQDEKRPVLHLWDPEADFQHKFTMQCGVQPGKGKIRRVERRYSDRRIFRWAYESQIVELQSGKDTFIGEAKVGTFTETSTGWKVKPGIYRVCDSQSDPLYDLRRCFIPINADIVQKNLLKERDEERNIYYKEWLEDKTYHSSGQIKEPLESADKIVLKELYVPAVISDTALDVGWLNEIPLEAEQKTLVPGRDYTLDDVRVKLKNKDGKYVASVNDVEAMLLDGSLISYFDGYNGHTERRKFYFAGMDDQGRLRFEWGYGYYFAADIQDVTDMQGNLIGNTLFFGDRIESFTFQYDLSARYRWKARTLLEDIHHEIEGKVWQDAEQMIIQLLGVKVNQVNGHVEIHEVSVANRKIPDRGKQSNSWEFKDIHRAHLKSNNMGALASQIESGQVEYILAYLNQKDYGKDSGYMEFIHIPLDGSDEQIEILNNKVVCLTAGRITDTGMSNRSSKVVNDQKIDFFLGSELPDNCEKPHVVVSVIRRSFSLDESRLRVYSRINPDAYYGNRMLVRLKEVNSGRNGIWSGSVLDTPFRSNSKLIAWLETKEDNIVTLGILEHDAQKLKCAEIAPGILCNITEFCGETQFDNGTIASLTLMDGKPQIEVILPGDIQYIPDDGRPAELLLMDGALNKYVQTIDMDTDTARKAKLSFGGHFTVAGFPQLRMQNPNLLDRMIRTEPPRLGMLSKNSQGNAIVKGANNIKAGYLEVSQENNMPVLNMISPIARTIFTSWDQITFKDGKPEEIIEHVKQGVWHYHDRFTSVYKEEEKRMQIKCLPDGENYKEILLFTDEEQRLRYLQKDLGKYGMSGREIVENGLPKKAQGYPVAGKTDHSLWIEIFPGKVLELPRAYLFTGKNKEKLSQLYVDAFSPGDEIWLDEDEVPIGMRSKILLMRFKFGARSAFGWGKAFLPIQKAEEDSVCLGGGFWKMNYPLDTQNIVNSKSKLVMLDKYNRLSNVKTVEQMMKGDCVFLTLDGKGNLCVAGGIGIKVELASESAWGKMAWLLHELQEDRRRVLKIFENYLPVIIIWKNEANTKIVVAYKRQENQKIEESTIFCCNCIGMLGDSEERKIVLRSGGYLFCVEEEELLKGVSHKTREHIIRYLSTRRTGFFMIKIDGKWKCGLNILDDPDKMETQMLYPIFEAGGILCRNRINLELQWLPLTYTCRVENVGIGEVWKILSEKRNRVAKLMEDGTLSLIHEQESDRRFRLLDLRNSKERVIPKTEVKNDKAYYYYLSELYPSNDLVLLKSENRQDCTSDIPVRIDILKKQEDSIIVLPRGQNRRKLNLSPWIAAACREVSSYGEGKGYLNCEVFQEYVPKRFEKYREVLEYAREDVSSAEGSNVILRDLEQLEEQLVYLYEIFKCNSPITNKGEVYSKVYSAVMEWLYQAGEFLASGFCDDEKNRKTLDLMPAIAAILLLNRIEFKNSTLGKELAVHLTCMLGYASGNSLHQEALLKLWLLKKERGGVWKRLRRLSLGGETTEDKSGGREAEPSEVFDGTLSEIQYNTLIEIAEGIAGRHVEDREAQIVAESLLYSVGVERDYTEYYEYLIRQRYCCSILSPLGRILMPQEGNNGFYELPKEQKNTLEVVWNLLRQKNQPIELLTDIPIPISNKQKKEAGEKCKLVIELLNKKIRNEKYRKIRKNFSSGELNEFSENN